MQIILLKNFKNLGNPGDVLEVKDGYGRNYLIPQKIAIRATEENKKMMLSRKQELDDYSNKYKQEAKDFSQVISNQRLIFIKKASSDKKLFGSVTNREISNKVKELLPLGSTYSIMYHNILLKDPIKQIGIYKIPILLHPQAQEVFIIVNVARSEEEAKKIFSEFDLENKEKQD